MGCACAGFAFKLEKFWAEMAVAEMIPGVKRCLTQKAMPKRIESWFDSKNTTGL